MAMLSFSRWYTAAVTSPRPPRKECFTPGLVLPAPLGLALAHHQRRGRGERAARAGVERQPSVGEKTMPPSGLTSVSSRVVPLSFSS